MAMGFLVRLNTAPRPLIKYYIQYLFLEAKLMFTFESTHHPRGGALCTFSVSEQRAVLSNAVGYQEPVSVQ